ncbi:formyl-CoA transferase [Rhodococcus sp. EPR-157]|uniref:CaiB/BaiF CoA transferase family protein n=1 Tax=Rhodococcus sp. EPR-157 TaxID=1813677 RepID=UPI0007BB17DE|nr:CoA transferase [Rhodococcus sp. EPR-157]KZF12534.1 formyl-CoA transferase [Rhodococcus sp. EPR-157]
MPIQDPLAESNALPLSGFRVLELGNYIAGPTAARLLADFGAEVIKVERPITGDETRSWRLYGGTTSMLFRTLNRNKKSIVLDLKTEEGRAHVLDLVASCDVVVENFRPGTLEKWGIGPAELDAVNPNVVVVRISAFGQTGPLSKRPGFAAVAEAYSGFRELVGDPDRPPVRVGVSIGDTIAALYAGFGAVMGLLHNLSRSEKEGPLPLSSRVIDVALSESMFSVMESLIPDYLAYGVERKRLGGRMEGIAPSNAYICSDGSSIVVAGNGDGIFVRYMHAIGRVDLATDPELAGGAGRWKRRDELDDAIGAWAATLTRPEALAVLDAAEVPSGPIHTAADICQDEQILSRNMIQSFCVDTGGPNPVDVGFPGIVPVIGERSVAIRDVGPELGQHTDEILGGLAKSKKPSAPIA